MDQPRSTQRRKKKEKNDEAALREEIIELAKDYGTLRIPTNYSYAEPEGMESKPQESRKDMEKRRTESSWKTAQKEEIMVK